MATKAPVAQQVVKPEPAKAGAPKRAMTLDEFKRKMGIKPIEELFPELLDRFPKGTTWQGLKPLAREGAMTLLFQKKFNRRVWYGRSGVENEAQKLEWSLRNNKIHPQLPTRAIEDHPLHGGLLLD